MMLVKVSPKFGDKALNEGRTIPRGSYIDASFREVDRQNVCRYRLSGDIPVFPIDLVGAEYFSSPAPLEALGLKAEPEMLAGMRLSFHLRTTAKAEDEPSDREALKKPEMLVSGCGCRPCRFILSARNLDSGGASGTAVCPLQGHLFPVSRRVR